MRSRASVTPRATGHHSPNGHTKSKETGIDIKGKRVLVTGADGFIGSHLTEHLLSAGANVRAFVYYNSFNSWGWLDEADPRVKQSIEIFAGDIRDPNGVRTAMSGCDVVMHLAALIEIPYSYHS